MIGTQTVKLVDDDGLIVLASAAGLIRRHASNTFEYDFPSELLRDAADEVACAWLTEVEGDVSLSIFAGDEVCAAGTVCGTLHIAEGDELLAMPYSAYTFACRTKGGRPPPQEALCVRLVVAPGRYECCVVARPPEDDVNATFRVVLRPTVAETAAPRAIPTVTLP